MSSKIWKYAALGLNALGLIVGLLGSVVNDKKDELLLKEEVATQVSEAFANQNVESES